MRQNRLVIIILFLIYFIAFFASYGFNSVVHAGYLGQFENFQIEGDQFVEDLANSSLDEGHVVSNWRIFQFAIQTYVISSLALDLQEIFQRQLIDVYDDHIIRSGISAYRVIPFENYSQLPLTKNISANINNETIFLGYYLNNDKVMPGKHLMVKYYWMTKKNASIDQNIFVHICPQTNSQEIKSKIESLGYDIFNGHRLDLDTTIVSEWKPGEVLEDTHYYEISYDMPIGVYQILVGIFKKSDGERYKVLDKDLNDGQNRIKLGTFEVTNSMTLSSLRSMILFPLAIPFKMLFLYYFLSSIHIILAILMSLTAVILAYQVYRNFGVIPSVFFFVMMCCSDWIIFFARNSYWFIFIYFLPLALGWAYPCFKRRIYLFYIAIFVVVLLKSLNDYEYITNVVLISSVPVVYYQILENNNLNREHIKTIFLPVIFSALVSIFAFLTALTIHMYSLYLKYGNTGFFNDIITKILDRTGVDNPYAPKLINHYSSIDIFNKLHPYNNDPLSQILYIIDNRVGYELTNILTVPYLHVMIPLYVIEIIVILICVSEIKFYSNGHGNIKLFSLSITTLASLIASNTWAVLTANGHMKYHMHMNPIIFYLPFLPIAYILISVKITEWLKNLKSLIRV